MMADLSQRFINQRSLIYYFLQEDHHQLEIMRGLVEIGFDPNYYTAIHRILTFHTDVTDQVKIQN